MMRAVAAHRQPVRDARPVRPAHQQVGNRTRDGDRLAGLRGGPDAAPVREERGRAAVRAPAAASPSTTRTTRPRAGRGSTPTTPPRRAHRRRARTSARSTAARRTSRAGPRRTAAPATPVSRPSAPHGARAACAQRPPRRLHRPRGNGGQQRRGQHGTGRGRTGPRLHGNFLPPPVAGQPPLAQRRCSRASSASAAMCPKACHIGPASTCRQIWSARSRSPRHQCQQPTP